MLRRTENGPDKLKVPSGYGPDRRENARRYLRNELPPIPMGSALLVIDEVRDIKFPTTIALDEDSCYWAAVLTRLRVVTITDTVLLYLMDEERMDERFVSTPRTTLVRISLELTRLARFGIGRDVLQRRKAWVALRIGRLLIMRRRYAEAERILRMVRAHPDFRSGWKASQYHARIATGRTAQAFGLRKPTQRSLPEGLRPPIRTMVITHDPAYPAVSGADLRNYQNALAASRLGATMLVSVRATERTTTCNGIAVAGLEIPGEPGGRPMVRRRTAAEWRIPLVALPRLLRLVREFQPDAIIVEGIGLGALLKPLRPFARLLVLDMHNVESDLHARMRGRTPLAGKILPRRFGRQGRIENRETKAMRIVDRVWVCSDQDRQRLGSFSKAEIPVDVVMNGIPRADRISSELPDPPGRADGWPVLLFIGHLGYRPNVEACERLARNILPTIRTRFGDARLLLAGRSPKPAIIELAGMPGVELVENPDDLSPLFECGHVSVVPLATGGGTRIKILEAMARGIPVVATPVAAEGLDFTPGESILIHETDEELAAAVIALCSDSARMENLRRRAHAEVRRRYGKAAVLEAVRLGMGLAAVGEQPHGQGS
jgi:glycosyltransferase involved in cell wall biosynthesis